MKTQYPALKNGTGTPNNLAKGETISFPDLTKVTVPTGGLTSWNVESAEGQKSVKTLKGIIVAQALTRALYASSYEDSGGEEPALCFSADSITGNINANPEIKVPEKLKDIGMPSGECDNCPFSKFGTKPKRDGFGRGQACQQRRLLMLLTAESCIPLLVSIPAGGLRNAKKYLVDLQAMGLEYWQTETSIELVQDKNRDGIKFSRPVFKMNEKLPLDACKQVKRYLESFNSQIKET